MTDQLRNLSGNPSIYLILPAYNEEKNIRSVLASLCHAFPEEHNQFHVVVNNSSDHTYLHALAEAASDKRIHVSNVRERIGKGGAILYGLRLASNTQYVGFADADGSITPEAIYCLIQAFQHDSSLDMAISSRWLSGSRLAKKQSIIRQLSSRSFNWLVRILFAFPYKDTQCGAKLIRTESWRKIASHVTERSFAFDIDLLWQAKKAQLTVAEIPIPWHDTPSSSVNVVQSAWPIAKALFRIRLGRKLER